MPIISQFTINYAILFFTALHIIINVTIAMKEEGHDRPLKFMVLPPFLNWCPFIFPH